MPDTNPDDGDLHPAVAAVADQYRRMVELRDRQVPTEAARLAELYDRLDTIDEPGVTKSAAAAACGVTKSTLFQLARKWRGWKPADR